VSARAFLVTRSGRNKAEGSMKRLVVALVVALLSVPAAFLATPAKPAAAALPPFSAIGDSTLLGMTSSAKSVLNASYAMLYDARSCRRLIITSCRGRGVIPPNTLQTMRAYQGRLGDAVVIMAGYDDWYNFGGAVDAIVAEARRQGVGRVIWLTYRSQGPYVGIGGAYFATYRQFNAILAQKVRQHPELILADWDTYTLGKSSWFAADGIHLSSAGAMALAHFLKAQLDAQDLYRCHGGTSGLPSSAPTPVPITQAPPGRFTPANQRLLDTRADPGDVVNAPVAAGHLVGLPLVAQGKVPAGTTAVMVNLTAVSACAGGFVTAFPCGSQVPLASNLNVGPARTRAALATVMLNGNGELCVYASQRMDLVIDLFGSFGPAGDLAVNPVPPDRFLDTRNAAGARNPATGRIGPATFTLPVAGVGSVPAGADGVVLNVTAVDPNANGFVTVHPCGVSPWVSNVNFKTGQIVANLAVARLDGAGRVCFTANVATHLVVDVVAWFGDTGLRVRAQTPQRLVDTRTGQGGVAGPVAGGGVAQVAVPGSGMLATVTAVTPAGSGYVTAYPCPNRPTASNLNYVAGDIVPNQVLLTPGAGGAGCLFTLAPAHLVVDRSATLVA
jgi:hypothetical protein